jgi:nucleoside-diphosphate-sugar epimerase
MSGRIVITGATGFIGRAVVPVCRQRGCEIVVLDRAAAASNPGLVVDRVRAFAPDAVVHLATHFLSDHRPDDIPALVRANVEWGTVVAEAASTAGARLVSIGTAWQHYEGRAYDPVSLYAATKQALDVVVEYFVRVRGLEASTVTLFDTYGPGDVRPKLIPLLMRAAHTGVPLEMSDGGQLIDLTYVDDVAAGIVEAALATATAPDCVLRSWSPLTIRDLVGILEASIARPVPVVWGARPARDREMRSDWVFGSAPVGWSPKMSLPDGLARTWTAFLEGAA